VSRLFGIIGHVTILYIVFLDGNRVYAFGKVSPIHISGSRVNVTTTKLEIKMPLKRVSS